MWSSARHYVHVEFYILAMDDDDRAPPGGAGGGRCGAASPSGCCSTRWARASSRVAGRWSEGLTAAGIAWRYMLPLFDLKELLRPDLRNHRKILVVDSRGRLHRLS